MGASIYKASTTGAAAISTTATVPAGQFYKLAHISLNLDVAPVANENYTITLDAAAGAAYDVLLYSLDLSAGSTTDLFWYPEAETFLGPGDAVVVAYVNTNTRTYGSQITMVAT